MQALLQKGKGLFCIVCSVLLAAALLPAIPTSTQQAYATSWDGNATGTATIGGLRNATSTVTLYQVAKTTLNTTNNTLSTVFTKGATTGIDWNAIDSNVAQGTLTISGLEGKDDNGTEIKAAANTIASYVLNSANTASFTSKTGLTSSAAGDDGLYTSTVSDLDAGLYLVSVTDSTNANVVYQNMLVAVNPDDQTDGTWSVPSGTVNLKSSTVTVNKYVGTSSEDTSTATSITTLGAGDYAYYTVTATVPTYSTTTGRTYTLSDTMPTGLALDATDGNITITSSEKTDLTAGDNNDYTLTATATGLTVAFHPAGLSKLAGQTITLKYRAQIGSGDYPAIKNTAELTYSTDSATDATNTDNPQKNTATVNTYKLMIAKQNTGNTNLAGAKFNLYEGADTTGTPVNSTPIETKSTGEVLLAQTLGTGTYTLVETAAPAGYSAVPNITITIAADGSNTASFASDAVSGQAVSISNSDSWSTDHTATVLVTDAVSNAGILPGTGGTGTVLITVIGLLIMAAAVTMIVRNRRKNNATK